MLKRKKKKKKKRKKLESKLDKRVQDLVKLISNVKLMQETLQEFNILTLIKCHLGNFQKKNK